MMKKPQKHPFLRDRTSYFEVWIDWDNELDQEMQRIGETDARTWHDAKRYPDFVQFYGNDPFYNVVVFTRSEISKNELRQYATDIYQGKYTRREISLKRDA